MKTAVIGGGAAGFFLAVNLKEMAPSMDVTIMERSQRVLQKVLVSGGGRCNCTNTFRGVRDLSAVYPRGHRLLKRLFKVFDHDDAYRWFEHHGVELIVQPDDCVFPRAQDARVVADCLLDNARQRGVDVRTGVSVDSLAALADYDFIVITTGGQPQEKGLQWIEGHEIETPVPSLFTLSIDDERLRELMGTVVDPVTVSLPGTKLRAEGPLLLTHWGVSGPAVLRLSSYAARHLHDCNYRAPLSINWAHAAEDEVRTMLETVSRRESSKWLNSVKPYGFSSRLWDYLAVKTLGQRAHSPWGSLNRKELNRLVNTLCNDTYQVSGRAPFKDEFVTCGGISLKNVNPATLESRHRQHLYFAGEVLDIDGVTGGFNFQAAWTTAYVVAQSIAQSVVAV